MKNRLSTRLITVATFAISAALSGASQAAEAPKSTATTSTTSTTAPKPVTTTNTSGPDYSVPQLGSYFRFVKPDGVTVITGGNMGVNVAAGDVIAISDKNAIAAGGGRCAFNVKYDEGSLVAFTNTTNRIFSNDVLIAQNTKIDLVPRVVKTIWTQPYFFAGVNNVRVVVNATGSVPSVRWIRVIVNGTCGAPVSTTRK
jgi:hypothetical protein